MQAKKSRPKIGDIIEIPLSSGFAYAQCINKHNQPPHWGFLIRVFSDIHQTQPENFDEIVAGSELFTVFFPLGVAVSRGIVKVIAHAVIPESYRKFPIFRASHLTPEGYKGGWWLWDGDNEWYVGELTMEQKQYPIRAIWNDTLLIQRIEEGWTSVDKY